MLMLAVLLIVSQGRDVSPPALVEAQRLYTEQRYREALAPLAAVIDDPASTAPARFQALELKALCLYLMESYPEARHVWRQLLALDPEHRPDPVMISPDLLEFFEEVRRAATAPTPSATTPTASEPAPHAEPLPQTELVPARVAVVHPALKVHATCAPYLCLLPFGGGQFVNGHTFKGAVFLGVDTIALATNLGLYYRRLAKYDSTDQIAKPDKDRERALWRVQQAAGGMLITSLIAGIVDAYLWP